jgi:AbrB family looped-hinge helix DNA binding protein
VSSRYQTVIPADIRERFCIKEGSRIAWIVRDDAIEVIPLPDKPWEEFRGAGRGIDYLKALAEHRAQERARARSESAASRGKDPAQP